jgi:Flp pilus assembly secretin CpaC
MSNLTDKDAQKNYATLLVIITPHVVRSTQDSGRTPMRRVDMKGSQ